MEVQWAIVGTDDEALAFAKRLKASASGKIKAIVSTSIYDSFWFAKQVGIPLYYGEMETIVKDNTVSSIYITQVDSSNLHYILRLLESGKCVIYNKLCIDTYPIEKYILRSYDKCTFYPESKLMPLEKA